MSDPVAALTRLADDAATARRGLGSLRHLVADPNVVAELADALSAVERAAQRFESERRRLLASEAFADTSPRDRGNARGALG